MLELHNLSRAFGGVRAVSDVSLCVPRGELRGLIGPNGAGKSTLFHLISGHHPPSAGRIAFDGMDISSLSPDQRAMRGIALVFQAARLFHEMTVLENVMVGAHTWLKYGLHDALLRTRAYRVSERLAMDAALEALDRVNLLSYQDARAESLPLGQQRRLQVARALCSKPGLLLLDEPASGLRDDERLSLLDLIKELNREGLTIMLVEHDVAFVTTLCQRITVLELGKVIAEGTPAEIRSTPRVVEAYLGSEQEQHD